MKNAKFDSYKFKKIVDISKKDVLLAIELFEQYFEEYPDDYSGYLIYASNLIKINRFEEAERIIKSAKQGYERSNFSTEKKDNLLRSITFTELRLLAYQEKYNEFIRLAGKNRQLLIDNKVNLGLVLAYCHNQLGRNTVELDDDSSYVMTQIIDYNENNLLEQLHKHTYTYCDEDESMQTMF